MDRDQVARPDPEYAHLSNRFCVGRKAYVSPPNLTQYYHTYTYRLQTLRPSVLKEARRLWVGDASPRIKVSEKILDIQEGHLCVICGTLYKDMPLKPTVLDEYSKDVGAKKTALNDKVWGPDDHLFLEDEQTRISLLADPQHPEAIKAEKMVTGMVIGVMGVESGSGDFLVRSVCFPGIPPIASPFPQNPPTKGVVILVSGLRVGEEGDGGGAADLRRVLFSEYVAGNIGRPDDPIQANISRVIVAGDSVVQPPDIAMNEKTVGGVIDRSSGMVKQTIDTTHIASLDMYLKQLSTSTNVDLMPGMCDPSNYILPQQPLNPFLLPCSSPLCSFRRVTNPYEFSLGGVRFLGSSGQSVLELAKYIEASPEPLDNLEDLLKWRHLSPHCPSTLGSFPFGETDPFVIENSPHVFFIGNQPSFGTRITETINGEKVRLVSIPTFSNTGTAAAIDLETLQCFPIHFGSAFSEP